jgi:hypothetical protein
MNAFVAKFGDDRPRQEHDVIANLRPPWRVLCMKSLVLSLNILLGKQNAKSVRCDFEQDSCGLKPSAYL